jgi:hypothetical protein
MTSPRYLQAQLKTAQADRQMTENSTTIMVYKQDGQKSQQLTSVTVAQPPIRDRLLAVKLK